MSTLRWDPFFVDVSESADLGYTLGRYELNSDDSAGHGQTIRGYYVTIWRKKSDGSWKFVFDTGNEIPPSEEKQ